MKLIDVFFPPVCPICFGYAGKAVLCAACGQRMKRLEAPSEKYITVDGKSVGAYYLYGYGSKDFQRYVFALKKNADRALFNDAAEKLLQILPKALLDNDAIITNIPRRKSNVRAFGYDHSQRIARALAKMTGVKYEKLLCRRGFSKEQKNLNAHMRRENVKGKFLAARKKGVERIVLVDDVITTGSSFRECVRELRRVYGNGVEITGVFLASQNGGTTNDK